MCIRDSPSSHAPYHLVDVVVAAIRIRHKAVGKRSVRLVDFGERVRSRIGRFATEGQRVGLVPTAHRKLTANIVRDVGILAVLVFFGQTKTRFSHWRTSLPRNYALQPIGASFAQIAVKIIGLLHAKTL